MGIIGLNNRSNSFKIIVSPSSVKLPVTDLLRVTEEIMLYTGISLLADPLSIHLSFALFINKSAAERLHVFHVF